MLNTLTTPERTRLRDNLVSQLTANGHSQENRKIKLMIDDANHLIEIQHNLAIFVCFFDYTADGTTIESQHLVFTAQKKHNFYQKVKKYPNDTRDALIQRWSNEKYDFWPTLEKVQQMEKSYLANKKVKSFFLPDTENGLLAMMTKLNASKWVNLIAPNDAVELKPQAHLNLTEADKQKISLNFAKYIHTHNLNMNNCAIFFDSGLTKEFDTSVITYKLEDVSMIIIMDEVLENRKKLYNMTLLFNPFGTDDPPVTFVKQLNLRLKLNDLLDLFTPYGPMWDSINPLG